MRRARFSCFASISRERSCILPWSKFLLRRLFLAAACFHLAFSETVFPSRSTALLHLFFFLQNFLAAGAAVLQIFFSEACELRFSCAWINSDFVSECLQFFG